MRTRLCLLAMLPLACGRPTTDEGSLFTNGQVEAGSGNESAETGTSGSSTSNGDGDGDGDPDTTTGGPKLDVFEDTSADDSTTGDDCECGEMDWSYVWIANSDEATVSKINTRTLVEEGRYRTGGTSPSRTTVSVDGKAMVVANRGTGLAKYWTLPEDCDPNANGTPGLQTSTGPNDVLAFGEDDCLDWFVPFPGMTVQRPVAWTPGEGDCHENQKIWTTTAAGGLSPTLCGPQGVWVHLLDGATGAIETTIHIPEGEFNCDHTNTGQGIGLGPYGGAVDYLGNFWFHGWGNNKLVRVDYETHDYEILSGGGYGITVDTEGRVWLSSSMSRYDHSNGEKVSANVSTSGGIAQDLQGRMWAAGQNGVVFVDMETLAIGQNIALPVNNQVKGVSVDIDGFIWAVAQGDTRAYKINPDDFTWEVFEGLNGPYTYSDMTGGMISNVACHPPEG
jgi:DNA-binding beta-propeller fold protein YncE